MYKSRSRSMQNGTVFHDREKVDLGEFYKDHPPAFTRRERSHFEFGSVDLPSFIAKLAPVIRELSKGGFRKPKDVSRLLNKKGIFTASGANWSPRLAYFLLSIIFSGKIEKQTTQSGTALKLSEPSNSNVLPAAKRPSQRIKPDILTPLTSAEMARRLAALGRVKVSKRAT